MMDFSFLHSSGESREEALKSLASVGLDRNISNKKNTSISGLRRFGGTEGEDSIRNRILYVFHSTLSNFQGKSLNGTKGSLQSRRKVSQLQHLFR